MLEPGRGLLDTVRDRFWAVWPWFGPIVGGTNHGQAPGLKPGFEEGTTGVTHRQGFGPKSEPAPELRTIRIHAVLLLA